MAASKKAKQYGYRTLKPVLAKTKAKKWQLDRIASKNDDLMDVIIRGCQATWNKSCTLFPCGNKLVLAYNPAWRIKEPKLVRSSQVRANPDEYVWWVDTPKLPE